MSLAMPRLLVLDRFEDGAAFAAAVLKGHRLGAKERYHFSVSGAAVRAPRISSRPRFRFVLRRWAARTSSPPGHAAWRTCECRSLRAVRGAERDPIHSNPYWFSVPWSGAALRAVRAADSA